MTTGCIYDAYELNFVVIVTLMHSKISRAVIMHFRSYLFKLLHFSIRVLWHFGRPFVKRFALCYRSVVCLYVTLVYCGQTVGRIKMKLSMQVGLGPGHYVLDGDPAPPPTKGA